MSRVMGHGGCRIASPAWQTKSLGARRQYSQATVNNVLPLMTDSPAFLTRPPNITHWHGCTAHSEMRYLRVQLPKKSTLSIHYVSIMMWIFYIDWQQYWKCGWTMNIGANRNAHGKRTVSTKQPHIAIPPHEPQPSYPAPQGWLATPSTPLSRGMAGCWQIYLF